MHIEKQLYVTSYDEDMSVYLRFIERGILAENLLTRNIFLPPLNFSSKRAGSLVITDGISVIKPRAASGSLGYPRYEEETRVVPRVYTTRPFL